jgi:hypothetical protein
VEEDNNGDDDGHEGGDRSVTSANFITLEKCEQMMKEFGDSHMCTVRCVASAIIYSSLWKLPLLPSHTTQPNPVHLLGLLAGNNVQPLQFRSGPTMQPKL